MCEVASAPRESESWAEEGGLYLGGSERFCFRRGRIQRQSAARGGSTWWVSWKGLGGVLACSGRHSKLPQTRGLKQQKLTSSQKSKVPAGLASSEASLRGLQVAAVPSVPTLLSLSICPFPNLFL